MTSDPLPARSPHHFRESYAGSRAPWEIGRPQAAFLAVGDRLTGRVLDSGCGTGDLAIWMAARGAHVTGVDFLEEPLELARRKAAARGLAVNFLHMDARAIGEIPERFDAVTDCGLFHSFDDASRAAYVAALGRLLEPGGRVFLLCVSDAEPGTHGPRRISAADLRHAFSRGWEIESLEPARFEFVTGIPGLEFTPAGPHAWFVVLRRIQASAEALA